MHVILCYYTNYCTHMNIKNTFISIAVTLLLGGMVACSESSSFPQSPIDDHYIAPPIDVDTTGMNIPSEAITVSEARKIGREWRISQDDFLKMGLGTFDDKDINQ